MQLIVKALEQRGHEVLVVMPETNFLLRTSENFTIKSYSVSYSQEEIDKVVRSIDEIAFTKLSRLEKISVIVKNVTVYDESVSFL